MSSIATRRYVSLDTYLDCALPPLAPGLNLAKVVQTLERAEAQNSAATAHPPEKTSKLLQDVIHAVVEASGLQGKSLEPFLRFQNNSAPITTFEDRTADTLPDSFLFAGQEPSWTTIAVSGEHREKNRHRDVEINKRKMTQSIFNCMSRDLRRRFVIGYTIEYMNMTLWYCDRAELVVSEPFNFVADHEHAARFLLSVLYAEPHQLGWDPTMVPLGDGCNYDITVWSGMESPKVYRTLDLVFDNGIRQDSRATRVWQAVLVEDGKEVGAPVALKDCWVDADQICEGTLIGLIRTSEHASEREDLRNDLFLTVHQHGYVFFDDAQDIMDRTRNFSQNCRGRYDEILHYRIVFEEVCYSLQQEPSLSKVFRALASAARALQFMHSGGWIHRDVSATNILLPADGTDARLIDLEFAKKMASCGQEAQFRVGTDEFRAVEVDEQAYEFQPSPHTRKQPPFRYNPLHDLESLWWTAVYFLITRDPRRVTGVAATSPEELDDDWDRDAQQSYAEQLFHSGVDAKMVAIKTPDVFRRGELLHPIVRPWAGFLEDLRKALLRFYKKAEKDIQSIDHKCADGLHKIFIEMFLALSNEVDKIHPSTSKTARKAELNTEPAAAHTDPVGNEDDTGMRREEATVPRRRTRAQCRNAEQSTEQPGTSDLSSKSQKPPKIARVASRNQVARPPSHRYNLRSRKKRS